ncbi:N-acetylmuramoyl-L-alanine amidase [Dehalobacter sp. UNSWDHB]|jgi:Putative cell wall-binding domain|uniref:cell wall-binding repeat-containing protein n=1 Tax=unclassified Dehalobacter TaxID=2635733 RepID=UPI00028BA702|nr:MULTISPECIES: cell wall-binding repeat-containing protein [unclassified Dehalobacter]AFV03503.1 N-acetylmuramoyl-L-alanine amidase [Dehalobacter sp. DCA]AFV06488.1 N-acetylmuramoyl-L-alanine amidase [Dehalobacter sp. CF]EQB22159.1 N-acetylmuramoyl-L-alanine amidase [Dehalobacter sp. UNSWDHB]
MKFRKNWLKFLLSMALIITITIAAIPLQAYAVQAVESKRLAGDNRTLTAIEISKEGWPSGSNAVILVRDNNFPDALAGAVLAAAYDAPILLTNSKALTPDTATELERLQAQTVFILGGTGAVSTAIEEGLSADYTVHRIAGDNRYETSANIAKYLQENQKLRTNKAVIAYAQNFPDALAVSSWAAQNGVPILLTETNTLPDATADVLTDLQISDTIITGGTSVISAQVESGLPNPTRYGGNNRYETAINLITGLGQATDTIFVATGTNFPDALAGSALAAKQGKAILLVGNGIDPSVQTFLTGKVGQINKIYSVGGTSVVKPLALNQIYSCIILEQPGEAFANAMDAIKVMDQDTADRYFSYDNFNDYDEPADITITDEDIALLFAKLDYNIVSSEINGDTATVTAEISNTDFAAVLDAYIDAVVRFGVEQALLPEAEQLSDEEAEKVIMQLLFDAIANEDQTTTTTIEVNLVKNNNSWTISMNDQLADAIMGGFISAFERI